MTSRKIDASTDKLYRVVCRRSGSDDAWKLVAGYNRTYVSASAARAMRTRLSGEHRRGHLCTRERESFDFAVQVAPVGEWEIHPDD